MKPYSENWRSACQAMLGIKPTALQKEIEDWWFGSDARAVQILGGERAGKSLLSADLLLPCIQPKPSDENEALIWIVGPDYVQARPEFSYIMEAFRRGGFIDGNPSVPQSISQPWTFRTTLNQRFMTRTSWEIMKLASFVVHAVIVAEAAQQSYDVPLKMLGRLAETRGPLILSGTLERGLPWYGDLYNRWQGENALGARSFSLPTWSNTYVFPGGEQDAEILKLKGQYPPDQFMERFGAVPRLMQGKVLPEFEYKKHVKTLEVAKDVPVQLFVDPGTHCYAVLFVQLIGPYCHVLDRVYKRGTTVQEVIPAVMDNPLFELVDRRDGNVIDFAARQHPGSQSQLEIWQKLAGVAFATKYRRLDETISVLRYRLGSYNSYHEPLVYFDSKMSNDRSVDGNEARDILAEFDLWKWPERTVNQNKAMVPIDKNNDAVKALGYGLAWHYGIFKEEKRKLGKAIRRTYWGDIMSKDRNKWASR